MFELLLKMAGFLGAFPHFFFQHYTPWPPWQLPPKINAFHFTYKLLENRVAARTGFLAARRLRICVQLYYFNIVWQKWVAALLLLPCKPQMKS